MSNNPCEHHAPGINPRMGASDSENIKITQHTDNSFKVMETYFRNQELTDVVIVAGDKRIPAHRLVLSAASKYFAEIFKNSTEDEIKLVGVDGDVLFSLVEYCYTGDIELQRENVETVLTIARLLELSPVVEACCQFLTKRLDSGNCLRLEKLAGPQGCAELSSAAHAYALKHFMDVIEKQQFLCLSAEDLAKLLESDGIIVPSEETVFHALMKWILHDSENRSDLAGELLSCVKLPLLSPAFISDHIENNELFRSQRTAQDLIIEALMFQLLPERKPTLVQSGHARPRKSTVDRLLLAVGKQSIDAFYPEDDVWKNVASTSDERQFFCSALFDDKLLVVGGKIAGAPTNTVKSFDFSNSSWNTLSPMNSPRYLPGAAVLDRFSYVVGGYDGSSCLNTVEKWDPVSQRWSYVAAMSTRRQGVSVAVLNNKLYAAGGHDGSTFLKTMECYDPNTDQWTPRAPMSKPRSQTSMGVVNGYLYVLGGWDGNNHLDSVKRYDPKTDTWCMVASTTAKRASLGVSALGSRLFAVGGYNAPPHSNVVEAYDPDLNEWQQFSPLEKSGERSCVVLNNFALRNSSF